MSTTKRVLIVDSDPLFGRFLSRLVLSLTHHEPIIVQTHNDAMKLLKNTEIDVVLTDIDTGQSQEYIDRTDRKVNVIVMSRHNEEHKGKLPKGVKFILKAAIMREQLMFIDNLE